MNQPITPSFVIDHAIGHVGLSFDAAGLRLELTEHARDADGYVDLGVLGVLFDLGCVQLDTSIAFLHADIAITQIAPPTGDVVRVDAEIVRQGGRTAVARLVAVDERQHTVAVSTQQLAIQPFDMTDFRQEMYGYLATPKLLDRPFAELIGVRREGEVTVLDQTAMTRNGFGGLHGGVTFGFVDAAVIGEVRSAAVRYLQPALDGPFRADVDVHGLHAAVNVFDQGASHLYVVTADLILR